LLVIAGLFLMNLAYGVEIDSITAKIVARNFYLARLAQSSLKQSTSVSDAFEIVLSHQENFESSKKGAGSSLDQLKPLYYAFNVKDQNGFVIVSGDDRVKPVLGYSFTGAFSKLDLPPAFTDWMSNYAEQIAYLLENSTEADQSILEEWSRLTSDVATKSTPQTDDVLPLLSTTWAQGCFYNELCPSDFTGPCGNALVGCVAVAMGQIMKFWDHPVSSNKIYGYYVNPDYGCLPDIAATYYNWSSMPDELTSMSTSSEIHAVSELLYNSGVASLMKYGTDGSGTSSWFAKGALISYFNYSSLIQYISRDSYTDENWETILRDELDNGRPVYYDGSGSGGHAFVCDGYQGLDYFHFNWGWGGTYNGYFYLSDLTPGESDFTEDQSAVIGIFPEENQADPFDNVLEVEGCGLDYTNTFSGEGAGAWDISNCSFSTPGHEQVYSFIAPETGFYSIEVVNANGIVAYSWRPANCGDPAWRCIGSVSSTGEYGTLYLTADTTYYILLDGMDMASNAHLFFLNCPTATIPVVEYYSHAIDDDNNNTSSGDNDGRAEPGESIEMTVTLRNIGDRDAHAVSAVLSTSDPYISINEDNVSFEDIAVANSVQSTENFGFGISNDCPERDVTFTLEITSDEDSWSEQFTVHVYIDLPAAPLIEYFSHLIDDNNSGYGDGDGIAESGESIKMPVTLRNIGDADAHNVSAVLSTSDSSVSVGVSSNNFYNIPEGLSAQSAGNYVFDIAEDCPEKDVVFNLAITSDEESWSDQFTVHVFYKDYTSIPYFHDDTKLLLYPNPAKDVLYLKSEIGIDSQFGIKIMDSMGRTVYSHSYPSFMKGNILEINLSDCNSGIYFFQINHSGTSSTRKIFVE